MNLAENIKSLREKQGMSLEDIGRRLSVTRTTVMRYERGIVQNIPLSRILLLAELFGCTPQHLMGWEDEFRDGNADVVNKLVSDHDLSTHLKKLTELAPGHKRTIYDMTAYLWDKEKG